MPRTKKWKNPRRINFIVEEEDYEKLIEVMKGDGYNDLTLYFNKLIERLLQ